MEIVIQAIQVAILMMIVQPCAEYLIHYFLHAIQEPHHMDHHHSVLDSRTVGLEMWALCIAAAMAVCKFYILSLGVMKYWIVHQLIHRFPEVFPALHSNHMKHHVSGRNHFGISVPF